MRDQVLKVIRVRYRFDTSTVAFDSFVAQWAPTPTRRPRIDMEDIQASARPRLSPIFPPMKRFRHIMQPQNLMDAAAGSSIAPGPSTRFRRLFDRHNIAKSLPPVPLKRFSRIFD